MKPVLQAILLAERVFEEATGKKIICGTFNRVLLNRNKPPQEPPQPLPEGAKRLIPAGNDIGCPSVYVSLTDVVPEVNMTLQFVNVSRNQVLLELPVNIKCNDRLATVEFAMPLPRLSVMVTEPGTYSIDLLWNGEIVGSHRVVAQDISEAVSGGG